jgi:archaellum component FlaC
MKKLAAVGALGFLASCLYAQGQSPGAQAKDDWEEINFEFNSSILSDGYPSLLRLADLLGQHRDYKVKVTGNTDSVGSAAYNDKLALARAETVKNFLVKYGAVAGQITTAGEGKQNPEVDNKTKEGRFINRRVVLTVTDAAGKLIKEGGINDVIHALDDRLNAIQDMLKKQEDCCSQILKRLDKLDDILAALKDLKGENDRLQTEVNDLRNQHNQLRDQVAGLPKPLSEQQTQTIVHEAAQKEATAAAEESRKGNKKFSLLGLNVGPTYGAGRQGNFNFSGRGQFFSPFGEDGTHAVQAQGEYMYYPGQQEGQFDIGLVNRWNNLQAGAFASFKYINFKQYQTGGALGQAAFLVDYIFKGGRVGFFGTQGFKNYAVLNSVTLAPGAYWQTYARVANQYGASFLLGTWGNAYVQGNVAYLRQHQGGPDKPGGMFKLVQPLSDYVSLTAEADLNQTLLNSADSGRLVFGVEFGNSMHPKEYASIKTPVPMDVPRVRYEFGTRRVGSSPPIADAGPNQLGISAGTVTLNGSGSYDPLGLALTYQWTQILGQTVTLATPTAATTTFTAAAGQSYSFRLTVKNTDGLQASATTSVSTTAPNAAAITQFAATPASIQSGQSSTLTWSVSNATAASISPGPGTVDPRTGSASVSPTQTTTYTLTATGATGNTTAQVTVTVGAAPAGNPQILRFAASPLTIQPGGSSTLSWTTTGATTVSISGVGAVNLNGSTTVSPAQTTTYILTASTADGHSVTAPITVTVTAGTIPQIVTFVANPTSVNAGSATQLCWQVTGATSIAINPGVGNNLSGNSCASVSPTQTTTYTLTASNSAGQIQANVTVSVGQVQILSFTSNPVYSTASGSPVVLSWATLNATSVVIVGNDISPTNQPVNGSLTVNPTSNDTYTLTAYGPGGQTVSVSISVFVR